jgi:DNA-directed RNA polymerase II subunit RPB2
VDQGLIKLKREHVARMPTRDPQRYGSGAQQSGLMNFDDTLKQGLIEFLDVEEEETAMIAMHISDLKQRKDCSYTHCEIHPSMILGVCASIIPFPDHNQVRAHLLLM